MAVSFVQDATGAEVRQETGKGYIVHLDIKDGQRNARLEFRATHTNLREPVSAWLDTSDAMLRDRVIAAEEQGLEVDYVIHVKRKAGVDPERLISDLGNREKIRELQTIARAGELPRQDAPERSSPGPGTAPTPRPAPPTREADIDARAAALADQIRADVHAKNHPDVPLTSAEADAVAEAEAAGRDPRDALARIRGMVAEAGAETVRQNEEAVRREHGPDAFRGDTPPQAPRPPAPRSPRRGVRTEEAKPWERLNSDGSLNLGSYEVQATTGMAGLAYELLLERWRTDRATGGELPPPDDDAVYWLAGHLLRAADWAQSSARADGRADRMDSSHTRARGALRAALDSYPPPPHLDIPEDRDGWLEDLRQAAARTLRIGIRLTEVPLLEASSTENTAP